MLILHPYLLSMRLFVLSIFLFLISCKSEFELLRTSNNPEKIYEAANKYYDQGDYDRAISLYDIVIQYYRGRQEAENMFYRYAYAHYKLNDFILAQTYFKNFSTTFANSIYKEEAEYMSAYSNYRQSPNYKLDQTPTIKAIEGFEQFINLYPNSERAIEANNLIDELRKKLELKSVEQGLLYYKIGDFQAATVTFQNTIKDFPESKRNEEIRFLILKSSYILATNSIYEKQQERFNETLQNYEKFIRKHPKSSYSKEAVKIYKDSKVQLKNFKV